MDARWHGPPTRAMRPSANTTFQNPVLKRRSVLCVPRTQNRRSATHGIDRRIVRIGSEPQVRRDSRSADSGYEMAFEPVRLAGRRSDPSGGQGVISQHFRVSEAIDRVVIDHAGRLHVGINHRGTNKRKSPPLEILAERV